MPRLVVERLSEGSVPAAGATVTKADAPTVSAIRLVFGVGTGPADAPTADTFKPVYTVSIPVFSLGGLDPDGVYEFDGRALLDLLATRSNRRKWGVRLELEVAQSAATVAAADLHVDSPVPMGVIGRSQTGVITTGGGRSVVVGSALVFDAAGVESLGGCYELSLRDADPDSDTPASIESPKRPVNVAFTRFEFEG